MNRIGKTTTLWVMVLLSVYLVGWSGAAVAAPLSHAAAAETLRSALLDAQLAMADDPAAAAAAWQTAVDTYDAALSPALAQTAADADSRVRAGLDAAADALAAGDAAAFAVARSRVWTSLLDASYRTVLASLDAGDGDAARAWLAVREFRHATRYSRPNADAALAVRDFGRGDLAVEEAKQAVDADLLDTYQARLGEALTAVQNADAKQFAVRGAESAALAAGYFAILTPAYAAQRGDAAAQDATAAFAALEQSVLAGGSPLGAPALAAVTDALHGFRGAPLSPAEQKRRAGMMMRFLALVPVEYGRGIRNGEVAVDLELQEAVTFRNGAAAAFADLEPILEELDAAAPERAAVLMAQMETQLRDATSGAAVADPAAVEATTNELLAVLTSAMPPAWGKQDSDADFDVVATTLDQMQAAVAAGDYVRAESARLEAYAVLETGPEARLIAFAPQYITPIEELFWYGQGDQSGLAYLLERGATRQEVGATRTALDTQLDAAQEALSGESAPFAVALNAALIVFREGLEAVVILAALLASMVGANRVYRRPMAWGVVLAFLATALTWWLAQQVLTTFSAYGERLEAVVSVIAVAVLLLITNWFFHRVYWKGWMANFHARKKALIGGVTMGPMVGFVLLGFSSVYREGFETVLFLQALVLESSVWRVLEGVALGMAGVLVVGYMTFRLQSRLPYKRLLVATGVLIGAVLLVMVGNTVHAMQIAGWMPVHPIRSLTLPYWLGLWFGTYPTWEGFALQFAAATFVIGSYYLAEYQQRKTIAHKQTAAATAQATSSS